MGKLSTKEDIRTGFEDMIPINPIGDGDYTPPSGYVIRGFIAAVAGNINLTHDAATGTNTTRTQVIPVSVGLNLFYIDITAALQASTTATGLIALVQRKWR